MDNKQQRHPLKAAQTQAISLCLINHNGLAYLREALAALQCMQPGVDEILVVDNASTDGSLEYLRSCQQVSVLALDHNAGPAGARNAGFAHAKHDLIVFQDNDICIVEGAIAALAAALDMDEGNVLAVPRVLYKADPETIQFEGADCHILGMMSLRQANMSCKTASNIAATTSSLVTACFVIHRGRWLGRQLFDEGLVFNLEDHDLGVRANVLGLTIVTVPDALVLHGAGTAGLSYREGYEVSATRIYCLIRNRWWIIFRYFSLRSLLLLGPLLLLFEVLQMLGLCARGWGRQWLRAAIDTGKQAGMLYHQRQRYQRERRRADRDILKVGNLPLTAAMRAGFVAGLAIKMFEGIMYGYWRLVKRLL
jgi:GT2 family glycosyltransferase